MAKKCCKGITVAPSQKNIVKAVKQNRGGVKSNRSPAGTIARQCPNCGTKTIVPVCPICSAKIIS